MKKIFSSLFCVFMLVLFVSWALPVPADAAVLDLKVKAEVMIGLQAVMVWLCTYVIKPLIDKLDSKLTPVVAIILGILGTFLTGAADGTGIGLILTGMLTGGVSMAGHDLGKCILGAFKLAGITVEK